MFRKVTRRIFVPAMAGAFLMLLSQPFHSRAQDGSNGPSLVYVMTNEANGNAVLSFHRNADGSVNQVQRISTHGAGSGGSADPLGSQGALTLSADGRLLFAVNAGSNTVTAIAAAVAAEVAAVAVGSARHPRSLANSAAVLRFPESHADAIRPDFGSIRCIRHGGEAYPSSSSSSRVPTSPVGSTYR